MSQHDSFIPKRPPGQDELPCDDGEPMETPLHRLQMNVLIDSLEDAWKDRPDFYVGGNMFVYFSQLQIKNNDFRGPDVFVVLDCERKRRKSWVAWEEGGKLPDVVIELVSETTAEVDRKEKKRIYERTWRLPEYFIYDPEATTLEAYRLEPIQREYVLIQPDEAGDVAVSRLGLKLGVRPSQIHLYEGPLLRWLDGDRPLPYGSELAQHERQRAQQERQRAEQARQRAEREQQRAGEERERAQRAEARVRELEEQLRRSKS